jgi:hypothetical protein
MDNGARTADGSVTELATASAYGSAVLGDYGGDLVCQWVVWRGDCFNGGGALRRTLCCGCGSLRGRRRRL